MKLRITLFLAITTLDSCVPAAKNRTADAGAAVVVIGCNQYRDCVGTVSADGTPTAESADGTPLPEWYFCSTQKPVTGCEDEWSAIKPVCPQVINQLSPPPQCLAANYCYQACFINVCGRDPDLDGSTDYESMAAGLGDSCNFCESGETNCNGTCTVVSTDSQNCGLCGTVCPVGSLCSGGVCS